MKKALLSLLAFAVVAIMILPSAIALDGADADITGTVYDSEGNPFADVTVSLKNTDGSDAGITGDTDPNGTFTLNGTTLTDSMIIVFEYTGLDTNVYGVVACSGLQAVGLNEYAIDVSSPASLIVVMALQSAVSITGKVTAEGNILTGVEINVYDESGVLLTGLGDETDAQGMFALTGIETFKKYYIDFKKDTYGLHPSMTSDPQSDRYVLITLTPSELNIAMIRTEGSIAGFVMNTDGNVLSEARLELKDSAGKLVATTWTNRDGQYTIRYFTGDYTLTASRSDHLLFTQNITITKTGISQFPVKQQDFVLESETKTYLFGTDLPHSLMFVGLAIGALVIVIAAVYRIRLNRDPNNPGNENEE